MPEQTTITIPPWPIIGAFAALAGMVIGAMGPWVTGPLGLSVNGLDGGKDGWGVLVCAGLGAFVLIVGMIKQRASKARWFLAGCGVASAALCAYDWQDVESKRSGDLENLIQVGWGLQLASISSGLLVVFAIVAKVGQTVPVSPAPAAADVPEQPVSR